jgi:four helix bundle protein
VNGVSAAKRIAPVQLVRFGRNQDSRRAIRPIVLNFQKLDVYQRSIQFVVVAVDVISRLPRGHAELAAQLRGSAQSTVANIAEGSGRRTRADAGHHYFIARGSAMESAAHLDVMKAMGVVDAERHQRGIEMLESVVAMLTKMCDL